jgi:Tol biopolymer transport system component
MMGLIILLMVSIISYRTGHMQIWRMQSDGTNQEQLTFDDNSNWFAHPSPDNKWIVFISYLSDESKITCLASMFN